MAEKKYLQFLKDKAEKETSAFQSKNYYPEITESLYRRLCLVCKHSLDILFVERVISKNLFDKYVENESNDEIVALENEFYLELSEKEDEVLKTNGNRLILSIKETIQSFIDFINEFMNRFAEDKKEIEETLFEGKKCNKIKSLSTDAGDSHNHGRTTIIVETDAGKFVYKPHDIQIDLWTKKFFEKFFPEVSKLPEVVCKKGYGYCKFVENTPAKTNESASKYYEKLGQFCSIATIMGSKDLHLENMLSDGIHPIPIDCEMMVCPIKDEEKVTNDYLERSIIGTGFMPFLIDSKVETSLLFSEDDGNLSAPTIEGRKVNVYNYQREFLKGFEDGYLAFLKEKDKIFEYAKQMPDFPVRYLFRGTKAYMTLVQKAFSYQWVKDENLDEEVMKALTVGFAKVGNNKPEMIESETRAVLQANVPYFYSTSNSLNLFDPEVLVKENFFIKSCKENLMEHINQIGLADLSFEKKIVEASFERFVRETNNPIKQNHNCSKQVDFIEQAESLFKKIVDKKIEAPDGTVLWFVIDPLCQTAMFPIGNSFVNGLLGIAVFAAALSANTTKAEIKKQSEELALRIITQVMSNISTYNRNDLIFENQINLGFDDGVAGMLHANELIDNYIHNPICNEFRNYLLSLLPKLDTSFTKADLFHGYAGIIKVLCKYENLYSRNGVAGFVSTCCDALLDKRVPLYKGMMLWDCFNNNRAISGAAHGQVGIASALFLAGKKLGRQDLLDAAKTAFEYEDIIFSDKLETWPDFRHNEKPIEAMHGFCSGAPGVGFEMLDYDTDLGKRNVDRAIRACLSKNLPIRDTVCCGKLSVVDFLLNSGLVSEGQERMNAILSDAQENGFQLTDKTFNNIFEVNLFYGASGVGYECLRCSNPSSVLPLYI